MISANRYPQWSSSRAKSWLGFIVKALTHTVTGLFCLLVEGVSDLFGYVLSSCLCALYPRRCIYNRGQSITIGILDCSPGVMLIEVLNYGWDRSGALLNVSRGVKVARSSHLDRYAEPHAYVNLSSHLVSYTWTLLGRLTDPTALHTSRMIEHRGSNARP